MPHIRNSRTRTNAKDRFVLITIAIFVSINILALIKWLAENFELAHTRSGLSTSVTTLTPLGDLLVELNGIPIEEIVVISPDTVANMRMIFNEGQTLGRNPRAFSKIGDSTIESPHFLDQYDQGKYNLGDYNYLQVVVDHFQGSFSRQGEAVHRGMHAWSIFDPMWVSTSNCHPSEGPIECEVRIHNPAFIIIRLGSNDIGSPDSFLQNMRALLDYNLQNGVLPIIGTKSDRNEGSTNINNKILRELCLEYQVPLWDFDVIAQTLPQHGMRADQVHLTYFPSADYTNPDALQSGYGVHNLSFLMMLYEILRILSIY